MSLIEPISEFNNYPATVMYEYGMYDLYFSYISIIKIKYKIKYMWMYYKTTCNEW